MNKNKSTLRDLFIDALKSYKKKDFKTAKILCSKILSIDSNHCESLILLANISAINKDFKQSKQLLSKAIDIQPKNVSVLNNLNNY